MKTVSIIILALLLPVFLQAQEIKPLYSLPEITAAKTTKKQQSSSQEKTIKKTDSKNSLVATDSGLYRISGAKTFVPLWTGGKVKQILPVEYSDSNGKAFYKYYFVTDKGILYSENLTDFELRNEGLPFLVIKKYNGEKTWFENQCQDLKDISVNPINPLEVVTATKEKVYYSNDGGLHWISLGSASSRTNGIKAVCVASLKFGSGENTHNETVVFMAHSILGFHYCFPDEKKLDWKEAQKGLAASDPSNSADEVSDILPVVVSDEAGRKYCEIFLAQTFIPRLYHFDISEEKSTPVYRGTEPADTIDALSRSGNSIVFMTPGSVNLYDMKSGEVKCIDENLKSYLEDFSASSSIVNAAWIASEKGVTGSSILLNEFWLKESGKILSPYAQKIDGKKSLYIPAYQAHLPGGFEKFKKIILDNKLNSLVIDMKDDYGLLRYDAQDSLVTQKGVVSKYALDLEKFVSEFKKDNIYLIARIVVFKDRNLTNYNDSEYAIWDKKTNRKWWGIKGTETLEDGTTQTNYYDEAWVDPFCPEVWEYNVAIAKELISRGFDEIQFDYIRFPTDGTNLYNAKFRWQSEGMDKESALVSFLSYARENIDAPVGIDIYGANGWYRSGTRTGQDVETLAHYVDVICPMFYPSHFEHKFMNYAPNEERPYRIYYYGTYRNTVIARDRIVARPWIQAFFLNVPYDRTYYDSDYVLKEVYGVRDSVDRGYMFWNNAGNYSKISPDPGDAPYTGKSYEAGAEFRKPAIGKKIDAVPPVQNEINEANPDNLSVLDAVRGQDDNLSGLKKNDYEYYSGFRPMLEINSMLTQPVAK